MSVWEVVGGGDRGGIVVREGQDISSAQLPDRLSTGARVKQLALEGERLHFVLLSGSGPSTGWVSLTFKGKALLTKVFEQPARHHAVGLDIFTLGPDTRRPEPPPRRPRVACLHGGASNEHIMRQQLQPLISHLGEDVELAFIEGKLLSKEVRFDERGLKNMKTMHAFFGEDQVLREHAVTKYGQQGDSGPFYYDRLDEGLAHCEERLAALEPVDALLGFSQGANFATMLAARSVEGAIKPLRCVVLLENDRPGWPSQKPWLFLQALRLPALVVSGEAESEAGDAVAQMFAGASVHRHDAGHRPLPKDKEACQALVEQIKTFILSNCR